MLLVMDAIGSHLLLVTHSLSLSKDVEWKNCGKHLNRFTTNNLVTHGKSLEHVYLCLELTKWLWVVVYKNVLWLCMVYKRLPYKGISPLPYCKVLLAKVQ